MDGVGVGVREYTRMAFHDSVHTCLEHSLDCSDEAVFSAYNTYIIKVLFR
jgi:hypothetical protein